MSHSKNSTQSSSHLENLRMDFSQNVTVDTRQSAWQPSPSASVLRIPLEREKEESGHTTSVVKYLPGASFSAHQHPLGEEIFVLEGVFSDEHGHYPAGTYIRNPPGSSHAPFSKDGCVLFVKLNQFEEQDQERVVIDTNAAQWLPGQGHLQVQPLHSHLTESVALVKWPKDEVFKPHTHFGGEEIFVLKGTFCDEHGEYPAGTWMRSKHLSTHHPFVKEETVIFVKVGHLAP